MKHLWEAEHSYYCSEFNYYNNETTARYKTLGAFLEAEADADLDYNLVFRWDWHEGEGWELIPYNGDDYYRNGEFKVFFVGQRKGLFRSAVVEVCRADEPAVIEYLRPRMQHLVELWEPLTAPSNEAA